MAGVCRCLGWRPGWRRHPALQFPEQPPHLVGRQGIDAGQEMIEIAMGHESRPFGLG